MSATKTDSPGLTRYSQLVLFVVVLPSLFVAGLQLFVFSDQTETYFAWTFALPLSAAYLGAGYWSAMVQAYGMRNKGWTYARSALPAAVTGTSLLTITTFLHLDKFHFNSPLFITLFVTWVWMLIYVTVPPMLVTIWIIQARLPGANVKGQNPLPVWMRSGYAVLAVVALVAALGLFIMPDAMSAIWPWAITPLAARAIGSWLGAFSVGCASLLVENDIKFSAGTCSSIITFCVLQLIVVARYPMAIDWAKPMAWGYVLFLVIGLLVTGASLWANKKLSS